jgi:regulator of protease activity HflC (stomatin/prohibitin superfamily)
MEKIDIKEFRASYANGWLMLVACVAIVIGIGWNVYDSIMTAAAPLLGFGVFALLILVMKGFTIIPPNCVVVLTFFGNYSGTILESGFFCRNPFASGRMVSMRIDNFATQPIKVNDKLGNPIEIGAVISWRIQDTAKAVFAVNDFSSYIQMACESAVREVASLRPYDHSLDEDDNEKTLRGDLDGVAVQLGNKVGEHVALAGIEIMTAKITHLAYAPEIAMAMLRRQQATAVVAARKQIVTGAVSMVKMALDEIKEQNIVELKDEQKAALVANLLTVLVSESETQPVITLNK